MARALRRAFNFSVSAAAFASALLFVGVCVLWVRTYAGPQLDYYVIHPSRSYGVGTECGAVIAFLQDERPDDREGDVNDVQIRRAGFRYLRITSDGMRRWNLVLPFWLLAPAAAVLPAWQVGRRVIARQRVKAGRCRACGYDLRATPEGGGALLDRCPECGAVPQTQRVM